MRKGRLVRRVPAVLALAAILGGCVAGGGRPAPAPGDGRRSVVLPPAAREKVLAEMRRMLESVSGVLQALAAQDLAAAETAARSSGMAMAADADPALMRQLPPLFRELGMMTHRGFDVVADRARARQPREELLHALSAVTGHCVACHAVYRLEAAP